MPIEDMENVERKIAYYESILDSRDALEEQREAEKREKEEYWDLLDPTRLSEIIIENPDVHFRTHQFNWKYPMQIVFKNEVVAKGSATSKPRIGSRIVISGLEEGRVEKVAIIEDISYKRSDRLLSVVVKDLEITQIVFE